MAGVPFAQVVFDELGLSVTWKMAEGSTIAVASGGRVVCAEVRGKCKDILHAERTALNILSRASGVATAAQRAVQIAKSANWHGYVAGTRKTTPGFRSVEKYALLVGGAPGMTGALVLATQGALRSGAGYVRVAAPAGKVSTLSAAASTAARSKART